MTRKKVLSVTLFVLLTVSILVLFTDAEISFVRWFNCGPLATQSEQMSEMCQKDYGAND